ncbi:MAG: class I SAM-dependent methyltransferase [Verrucomicrobia bacterium]|nr:class I SAM-dependent methyltransferase [Verrucomicrobiota bacterium]
MSKSCFRRTTCRLCESAELDLALQLQPMPIADGFVPAALKDEPQESFPLDLFLCRACGHAQLLDVVDPEILYRSYLYTTSTSLGLDQHYKQYAADLVAVAKPPPGGLVIELGSNDGTLLRCFQAHGLRTLGIDPAREVARGATERGVETLPEYFTTELARCLRRERGPADIICANNVIANIDQVGDAFDGVKELLAPEGVFVFETGYQLPIIQNLLFETIYHEHLDYHSVKPMQAFCQRHGLRLFAAKHIPTKGGSLRGLVCHASSARATDNSVAELIRLETEAGIHTLAAHHAYGARIEKLKQDLLTLLRDLRRQGKTLAAFGAANAVTTLTHHFEIGEFISFVVDDNPKKQGTFSPGCHTPVLPMQALYERKPDYVLVLAWRFLEPFQKKNQAFLDQGGHFIVPLPELRMI